MTFLDKVVELATGGLGQQVVSLVEKYFPPDMPAATKAELQVALERLAMEREQAAWRASLEAEEAMTRRIGELEGTAADLKSLPIVGPVMLFLRGMQRPLIGYATIWMDFRVFSGAWTIADEMQNSAFWLINALVLAFLFGERAFQNVAPLVTEMMRVRGGMK